MLLQNREYRLVWQDEFNSFDAAKWIKGSPQTWTDLYGSIKAWDPSLVSVANGQLRLAVDQRADGWYGGLVEARDLASWKFGYFEFKAKVPAGQGLWSALWMMPEDNAYGYWPKSGEIDVLEHLGKSNEVSNGYSTLHYSVNGQHAQKYVAATGPDWTKDWHTWAVQWDRGSDGHIRFDFYVDGRAYGTITDSQFPAAPGGTQGSPFDQVFYPIMNLTVGGAWAGAPTAAVDGAELLVDWFRVYQATGGTGTTVSGTSGTPTIPPATTSGAGAGAAGAILGTAAGEQLSGTSLGEQILALGGDDVVYANGGNDTITGGAGLDYITAGSGADVIVIRPGEGTDKVTDYLDATDKIGLAGGPRAENLRFAFDSVWNYTWVMDSAGNKLVGLKNILPSQISASDFVAVDALSSSSSTSGSTTTTGPTGQFSGRSGTDASEAIAGTGGNDLIRGLGGIDTIYGSAGNDTISAGRGDDFVYGGVGIDVVKLEPGLGLDKFYDFQNGIDKVGLAGGLRFQDLRFKFDPTWNYTWVTDSAGNELLGLKNLPLVYVDSSDFIPLDANLI